MGVAPGIALHGPMFSWVLRTCHAFALGISILLLVSICLGRRGFGVAGNRLPQTENLMEDSLDWLVNET
jgi:hypothetical protein